MELTYTPASLIRVSSLSLSPLEHEYAARVLRSGNLTQGPIVAQLEEQFASLCGARHAVACNSGTSALHLAYLALGLGPGDAIITSPLTYVATANAARYCGAEVLFADVREDDWTIDARCINNLLRMDSSYRTIYTVPVHLYDAQTGYCGSVLDAAHTVPSVFVRQGVINAYSFYASKVIGCGEGGMVTTNDPFLASRMRLYRGQGATTPGAYHHSVVGYNYRMTDLTAAVALAQLERLPELLAQRRSVIDRYRTNLATSLLTMQGGVRASAWMFACLLPEESDTTCPACRGAGFFFGLTGHDSPIAGEARCTKCRGRGRVKGGAGLVYEDVAGRLRQAQIETRPFFIPLHLLPMYGGEDAPILPVAEGVWGRGICLPTHADLAIEEVDYVCEKVIGLLEVLK